MNRRDFLFIVLLFPGVLVSKGQYNCFSVQEVISLLNANIFTRKFKTVEIKQIHISLNFFAN